MFVISFLTGLAIISKIKEGFILKKYQKLFNFIRNIEPNEDAVLNDEHKALIRQILGKRISAEAFATLFFKLTTISEACAKGVHFVYELPLNTTFNYCIWFYIPYFRWEKFKLWMANK